MFQLMSTHFSSTYKLSTRYWESLIMLACCLAVMTAYQQVRFAPVHLYPYIGLFLGVHMHMHMLMKDNSFTTWVTWQKEQMRTFTIYCLYFRARRCEPQYREQELLLCFILWWPYGAAGSSQEGSDLGLCTWWKSGCYCSSFIETRWCEVHYSSNR